MCVYRPQDDTFTPCIVLAYTDRHSCGGTCIQRLYRIPYGGAIGFDTLVSLKIIEKKEKYPHIKLHLYLPCHGQESMWNDNLKRAYYYVLKRADSVRYSSESYTQGCMHKRNREMVDRANLCVAYCSGGKGGSAYTVSYAEKNGIPIINLFK